VKPATPAVPIAADVAPTTTGWTEEMQQIQDNQQQRISDSDSSSSSSDDQTTTTQTVVNIDSIRSANVGICSSTQQRPPTPPIHPRSKNYQPYRSRRIQTLNQARIHAQNQSIGANSGANSGASSGANSGENSGANSERESVKAVKRRFARDRVRLQQTRPPRISRPRLNDESDSPRPTSEGSFDETQSSYLAEAMSPFTSTLTSTLTDQPPPPQSARPQSPPEPESRPNISQILHTSLTIFLGLIVVILLGEITKRD